MRMSIIAAVLASLAPAVSAQHSVNCWGKASHAPFDKLITAVHTMDRAINMAPTPLGPSVRADKNDCHELWCEKDVSIRFCNENTDQARSMPLQNIVNSLNAIMHDCATTYKGEKVAGGVVDHPDKWSVVVQMDDQCKPASY